MSAYFELSKIIDFTVLPTIYFSSFSGGDGKNIMISGIEHSLNIRLRDIREMNRCKRSIIGD